MRERGMVQIENVLTVPSVEVALSVGSLIGMTNSNTEKK